MDGQPLLRIHGQGLARRDPEELRVEVARVGDEGEVEVAEVVINTLLCLVGMLILRMPYALLISVIVGVTNIIPFFGPFIGAVPSALLVLLVDPFKCLIFVIFIIVLQQVDGNIIGPKVLGSSIGINGFWVMFSIILGAGLFGFWGMLLGVPVFVVIYTAINEQIDKKLKKSDLPWETADYIGVDYIDPVTYERVMKHAESDESADGAETAAPAGEEEHKKS